MCPLLWCRDDFDDLQSCQHHLLTCPWLTDSWYWCPFCHRPERFRASEAMHIDCVTSLAIGKASRLKRAVSFFKHFGRKSTTRAKRSVSSYELGDHSHCCLSELQGTGSTPMSRNLQDLNAQKWRHDSQWTSQEPCEKGIDPDDCYDELKIRSYSGQHTKVNNAKPTHDPVQICGTPVAELPAYRQSRGTDSLSISASNIACLEFKNVDYDNKYNKFAVSPLAQPSSPDNESTIRSESASLMPIMSNIFPTPNPTSSILAPAIAIDQDPRSPVDLQGPVCSPQGLDHHRNFFSSRGDICYPLVPFSCFGKSTNDRSFTTTETLVEDLSDLVCVLHVAWMQRLTTNIGEPMMKAKISQRSPFETGIRVLRQYWNGRELPKVFEDAFALMHIAFACAWIYHRDDTPEFWNTFFQDVLKWHHVLLTHEDRILFLKVADLIWSPPGSLSVEDMFHSGSLSLPHGSHLSTLFELEGNAPIQASYAQELVPHGLYSQSSQSLVGLTNMDFRAGEVIRICAHYLDGIEFSDICKRDARQMSQSSWFTKTPLDIQLIKTYMIDALMQCPGLDDFRNHIIETESLLHRGLLHNAREVELKLTFVNELSRRSASYNKYRTMVASLCDEVMLLRNTSWRHKYYEKDLRQVLDISQTKLHSGSLPISSRPRLNTALAITGQQRPHQESPLSARSDRSLDSINSVSATLTPSTFPSSSGSPSNDDHFIFTPEISPSSSPVELPAPDPSSFLPLRTAKNTSLRCNICNTSFSGSKRDQTSNFQRHRRTMHSNRSELSCPEVDCDKSYSRSDNLLKHRRVVHGLV